MSIGQGVHKSFRSSGPSGVTTSVQLNDWHRLQTVNLYRLHYWGHLSLLEYVARLLDTKEEHHHQVEHIHRSCRKLDSRYEHAS